MLSRALFSVFVVTLALQLLSLEPVLFSFAQRSVGVITTASEDVLSYTLNASAEATLTVTGQAQEYDALVFVGDVMLGRHVETLLNRHGSNHPYLGLRLKDISQNPAVIANFESAMSEIHTQTPAFAMRFSVDEKHLPAFAQEVTHVSLANNHSLDFGESGYYTAVSLLEKYGVFVFGHGDEISVRSISYVPSIRGEIAIIGINATARIPEEFEIASVCTEAKRNSDFQVVSIHWGDEYKETHSETQRVLAEVLVDACADLVIGHHPHVVQDIDMIKGVPILYSLGNYIFDQYFSTEVQEGLVVSLLFEESPVLELTPVSSKETPSVPKPLLAEARTDFLANLASKSHPSLQNSILAGRINLFEPVATSTKIAIMSR